MWGSELSENRKQLRGDDEAENEDQRHGADIQDSTNSWRTIVQHRGHDFFRNQESDQQEYDYQRNDGAHADHRLARNSGGGHCGRHIRIITHVNLAVN
jgi:hypothetical protein